MPRKKKSDLQGATPNAPTANPGARPDAAAPERPAFEQEGAGEPVPEVPAAEASPLDELFTNRGGPRSVGEEDAERAGVSDMLDRMTLQELYLLRQDIDGRLPPHTLTEVDLVEELLLQYQIAKALLASVINSPAVQANQKAQVQNSCAALLEQVTKTQTALYNAEMMKAMEQSLEKAFGTAPQHIKEAFYARYEQVLREAAGRRQERKAGG